MATSRAKRPSLAALADNLLVQERDAALARLELAHARQESLACRLSALVAHLRKMDGYMTHDVQQELRASEALLAEGKP